MEIFVVDDCPIIGKVLKDILISVVTESKVHYFSSIEHLLKSMSKQEPDIVLIDTHIDKYCGWELGAEILNEYDIKLIYFSKNASNISIEKAKLIGASALISKSLTINALTRTFNEILTYNKNGSVAKF